MAELPEFDRHTALEALGEGRYRAVLDGGWHVGGGLNGGYQLALAGAAMSAELAASGKPDPLAVSASYLAAAVDGPGELVVRVVRDGGRTSVVTCDLVQDGVTRLTALATYGDLARDADDVRTTAEPLVLPPREECIGSEFAPAEFRASVPLIDRFEMLYPAEFAGCFVGAPSRQGALAAWFRLKDGREPDPISLLLAVDALPPVTFDLGIPGWAPTVQLTAHVRARPAPGWLRLVHRTRNVAGGMFEEDCEVWDERDRLVAQGRQLALLPR